LLKRHRTNQTPFLYIFKWRPINISEHSRVIFEVTDPQNLWIVKCWKV